MENRVMSLDFFLVGPTLELRSVPESVVAQPDVFRCEMLVTENGSELGWAFARPSRFGLQLGFNLRAPLAQGRLAEGFRLLARMAGSLVRHGQPLWMYPIPGCEDLERQMNEDGFREDAAAQIWIRPAGAFFVSELQKVSQSHELYQEFLNVPWNFVPREWDVIGKLAHDAKAAFPDQDRIPHLKVLDLGCGSGKNSTTLEALGFDVFGLDLSETAIARCKTLVKAPDHFVAGSAAALPWGDASFDMVADIGCLHCAASELRPGIASEIARVLKPEGTFYSRSFKPRDPGWVQSMPIRMDSFGLDLNELQEILAPHFEISEWMPSEQFNYLRGRRLGALTGSSAAAGARESQ